MTISSRKSIGPPRSVPVPHSVKIVIAGRSGSDTAAFIRSISDSLATAPTQSPAEAGAAGEPNNGRPDTNTSAVLHIGRILLAQDLVLFLFGIGGARALRDEVARGAAGAVVLAFPGHEASGRAAIDYFGAYGIPFVVAVPRVEDSTAADDDLRAQLGIPRNGLVLATDTRARASIKAVLTTLIEHAIAQKAP
ncbi:hypothetical protein [Streptomyces sp. NPDC056661]|uniref:hypothetical protein n=1 Tax=Streptomyces sp. NPDC056661 TaxID=3345898 RepID=UPI003685802A